MKRQNNKFLFVNKNSSSDVLTRSKAREKHEIQSHVQSKRRIREAGSQAQPWSEFIIEDAEVFMTRDESQIQQFKECSRHSYSVVRTQSSPARLPSLYPSNNASDPFHSTVAGATAGNHSLLNWTFNRAAKHVFLAEAFAPAWVASRRSLMRHNAVMDQRLRKCIEDDMLMNSTLAYGSCYQGWFLGKIELDRPPEFFIGRTLQAVRMRLSQTNTRIDKWFLLSVYALAVTEYWSGNPAMWTRNPERYARASHSDRDSWNTARTHMIALLELVQKAGGWSALDPYILESAILADKYMAMTAMRPPLIACTWDPGALPPSLQTYHDYSDEHESLGDAFSDLQISGNLSQVLDDLVAYIKTSYRLWTRREATLEDESWAFYRLQALIYHLLNLEVDPRDHCIRLSVLIFLHNAIPYHGAQVCSRMLIAHLKLALPLATFEDTRPASALYLWCLCTGGMTSEPSAERDWFTEMADGFLPAVVQSKTLEDIRSFLERFMFLPLQQEAQLVDFVRRLYLREVFE